MGLAAAEWVRYKSTRFEFGFEAENLLRWDDAEADCVAQGSQLVPFACRYDWLAGQPGGWLDTTPAIETMFLYPGVHGALTHCYSIPLHTCRRASSQLPQTFPQHLGVRNLHQRSHEEGVARSM